MKYVNLAFAALMTLYAAQAFAQSFKVGTIEVDQPWMRATPKGAGFRSRIFPHYQFRNHSRSAHRRIERPWHRASKSTR